MNKVVLIAVLVTVIVSSATLMTPVVKAANISQSICEYVAVDDKKRLRSFLKTNRLKIRKLFKGIACNNQNILIFAASSNSENVGKMIIGKLSKKIISKNLDEITKHSATLAEIAKKRIE